MVRSGRGARPPQAVLALEAASLGSRIQALLRSGFGLILILLVFSTVVVATNVSKNPQLSPLDEYVYLDYLSKVPTQGFVRSGEETGELARQEIACRGVLGYGLYGDPCTSATFDQDALYPYNGRTGADIYTPAYFAVTWVVAQPLVGAGVGLLDAGRLVGVLWLFLGSALLLGLLRSLGASRGVSLGLVLVTMATPAVFWATTYVSTDAPSLAVSAGLAWAGVAVYRRRLPSVWFPVLAVIAVLFKVQNLAIVGLVASVLVTLRIVAAHRDRRADSGGGPFWAGLLRDRLVWVSVSTVLAVVAAQAAWLAFRSVEALPGVASAGIDSTQLQPSATGMLAESLRFIWTIGASGPADDPVGIVAANALTAVAIAAIVVAILRPASTSTEIVVISGATLGIALTMGPALALATYAVAGYYVPLPARYGIVLLPAFVACIALFLGSWGRKGSAVVAIGGAMALALAILL